MAGYQVCSGATLSCTCGTVPSTLAVTSQSVYKIDGLLAATVEDFISETNVPSFTMCTSTENPTVQAAMDSTGVQEGACSPMITTVWAPGSTVRTFNGFAGLTSGDTLTCSYLGTISITSPAQTIETDST